MTAHRPRFRWPARRSLLLLGTGLVVLLTAVVPLGLLGAGATHAAVRPSRSVATPASGSLLARSEGATSIVEVGTAPSTAVVGTPTPFAWQALGPGGARVTSFAAAGELTVTASANGSSQRAWVNASAHRPLDRSANGTFSVPASAWSAGVLNLTVSVGAAVPVTVRLFGPLLPTAPAPVALSVLPDLDHLVLYDPVNGTRAVVRGWWTNDTFWHVRDRFGDPTPGAFLTVEYATANRTAKTIVPVTWATGGTTGAWLNYSASDTENGTFSVTDAANTTLLGPTTVPAVVSPTPPATASLSPVILAAVALLAVAAVVGMVGLALGGRTRPAATPASTDAEEELRRLAEGRETVVEIVRRSGPLGLAEIEAAWEPPPAPPAVADWVASLVTDGTLTASLGDGGRARFALAERPVVEEPKVTFDEAALEREIARRDAAVDSEDAGEDEGGRPSG